MFQLTPPTSNQLGMVGIPLEGPIDPWADPASIKLGWLSQNHLSGQPAGINAAGINADPPGQQRKGLRWIGVTPPRANYGAQCHLQHSHPNRTPLLSIYRMKAVPLRGGACRDERLKGADKSRAGERFHTPARSADLGRLPVLQSKSRQNRTPAQSGVAGDSSKHF